MRSVPTQFIYLANATRPALFTRILVLNPALFYCFLGFCFLLSLLFYHVRCSFSSHNVIHRINLYLADNALSFAITYPLDNDLSARYKTEPRSLTIPHKQGHILYPSLRETSDTAYKFRGATSLKFKQQENESPTSLTSFGKHLHALEFILLVLIKNGVTMAPLATDSSPVKNDGVSKQF